VSESSDHLRDALRAAGRRLTSQRRLILEVLEESDQHLDAEALYEQVKVRDPDVSLATIYRTLAVFKEVLREQEGVRITGTHLHVSGYCARCQGGSEGAPA
jgi:Fe2+ or Zn2+ uptake regulation protein